jgi:hypothetical protein
MDYFVQLSDGESIKTDVDGKDAIESAFANKSISPFVKIRAAIRVGKSTVEAQVDLNIEQVVLIVAYADIEDALTRL